MSSSSASSSTAPSSASLASGATSATNKRVPAACNFCRVRKLRCDGQVPCRQCARRAIECVYSEAAETRKRRRRAFTASEVAGTAMDVSLLSPPSSHQQYTPHTSGMAALPVDAHANTSTAGGQTLHVAGNPTPSNPFRPQRPHSQSFTQHISPFTSASTSFAMTPQAPMSGQSLSSWTLTELGMGYPSVAPVNFAPTSPSLRREDNLQTYFSAYDFHQAQQQPYSSDRPPPS
jgi:hypothetical protein